MKVKGKNMNDFSISPTSQIVSNGNVFDSSCIKSRVEVIKTLIKDKNVGGPIGIYCPKNEWRIICIISLLQLGIPYVPIEIGTPKKRINYILNDCNINCVISYSEYGTLFEETDLVLLDYISKEVEAEHGEHKESSGAGINKLAYILYTSGTTGNPKGVMITRNNLNSFIHSFITNVSLEEVSKVLCLTNYTFDIFFVEAILPILLGKTVVLANEEECENPKVIVKLIKNMSIDCIQMTPTIVLQIHSVDPFFEAFSCAKNILIGGEMFPEKLLADLLNNTSANIYNLYGPTEATIWAMFSELREKNYVNIGTPLDGTKIYLSEDGEREVEKGEIGEIYIGGPLVAEGYIDKQGILNEKFTTFSGERVYKTGDYAFLDDMDNYVYVGRKDNQIKLRGHRIELEEIEKVIQQIQGILQVVVIVSGDEAENQKLVAFYTSVKKIENTEISKHMMDMLPQYMVPDVFVCREKFPVNERGKIDKKKMKEMYLKEKIKVSVCEENDEVSSEILSVLYELSEAAKIELNTELEALCLSSLGYISLIVKIEELYDLRFEDDNIMKFSKLKVNDLVDYVKERVV